VRRRAQRPVGSVSEGRDVPAGRPLTRATADQAGGCRRDYRNTWRFLGNDRNQRTRLFRGRRDRRHGRPFPWRRRHRAVLAQPARRRRVHYVLRRAHAAGGGHQRADAGRPVLCPGGTGAAGRGQVRRALLRLPRYRGRADRSAAADLPGVRLARAGGRRLPARAGPGHRRGLRGCRAVQLPHSSPARRPDARHHRRHAGDAGHQRQGLSGHPGCLSARALRPGGRGRQRLLLVAGGGAPGGPGPAGRRV
jgi:hypothetical protein